MTPTRDAWEAPEIVEMGNATDIIQGGGDCCHDMPGLQGNKEFSPPMTDQYDDLN